MPVKLAPLVCGGTDFAVGATGWAVGFGGGFVGASVGTFVGIRVGIRVGVSVGINVGLGVAVGGNFVDTKIEGNGEIEKVIDGLMIFWTARILN